MLIQKSYLNQHSKNPGGLRRDIFCLVTLLIILDSDDIDVKFGKSLMSSMDDLWKTEEHKQQQQQNK